VDFIFGECMSQQDAIEFIHFKMYEGWRVMCPPFESADRYGWDFLLYRMR